MSVRNTWITVGVMLALAMTAAIAGTGSEPLVGESDGILRGPVHVPVLAYHHVAPAVSAKSHGSISCAKFERDMDILCRKGYQAISFRELYDYLDKGTTLPSKPILITFDDGYLSNYQYAWPILRAHRMKAVFYVIGWSVGQDHNPAGKKILPHFDWEQAREMVKSGDIEIGSHTYDLHTVYGTSGGTGKKTGYGARRMRIESHEDYERRLSADLKRSAEDMKAHLGRGPDSISYPFGVYEADTEQIARRYFKGSFTITPSIRTFRTTEDLYAVPRILADERTDVLKELARCSREPSTPWMTVGLWAAGLLWLPALAGIPMVLGCRCDTLDSGTEAEDEQSDSKDQDG